MTNGFNNIFEKRETIMKTNKKVLAVVAAVAVLCMSLMGCGQKLEPADQTIGALFELAAKGETDPMMNLLGFASSDEVFEAFFEEGAAVAEDTELINELKAEFASVGVEITDEELQEFSDAMNAVIDKVTYTTEITSETKDAVTVTVKVKGLSEAELEQVMLDAANTMSANLTENLTEEEAAAIMEGDMSVVTSYMQQYLRDVIAGVATLEPSVDSEFTVNCEKLAVEAGGKQKVAWLPADMNQFASQVETALYQ